MKGSLAICGAGTLGLITSDSQKEVTYPGGNKGTAWTGIHLTDKIAPIGSPWSSRSPVVVGRIEGQRILLDNPPPTQVV